jgi:hypothetical protein
MSRRHVTAANTLANRPDVRIDQSIRHALVLMVSTTTWICEVP